MKPRLFMRYSLLLSAAIILGAALASCESERGAPPAASTTGAGSPLAPSEQEWAPYRNFYPVFLRFRDEAAQYPALRLRLKVMPRRAALPTEGLMLRLASRSIDMQLPVESIGGVDLPISTIAYEEDGVLRLNRAKGEYSFTTQYSIQVRPGGVYSSEWLRQACAQGLVVKKTLGLSHRLDLIGKSCTGVTFQFGAPGEAAVTFKDAGGSVRPLSGETFSYGPAGAIRLAYVRYRFGDWPPQGEIVTQGRVEVIDFLFE